MAFIYIRAVRWSKPSVRSGKPATAVFTAGEKERMPQLPLDVIIDSLDEEDQRRIFVKLSKKFKIRETNRLPREKKVVISGKILALKEMKDLNLSQMKSALKFTMDALDMAGKQNKNRKRG